MNHVSVYFLTFGIVFVLTVVILRKMIPFLASKKIGQKILEIGPRWHKNKEGTPTMGGVSFIIAGIIAFVILMIMLLKNSYKKELLCVLNILVFAILNGMIGLIDDLAKMKKAQNKGLSAKMKFLLQSLVAILFLISLNFTLGIDTKLYIPFFDFYLELGFLYYIIAYLMICGVINSVNLSDGIDGLASSTVATVGIFFSVANFIIIQSYVISFFSALILASAIGFLIYNFYPAKVFMGDTGSLYLGALVVSMSFLIDNILLVLIYGFVFICEAISDILQVIYFKISKGKRLLKMAPLHHHFEKCGWSEIKIVTLFTFLNIVFCTVAYLGLGNI